MDGNTGWDSSLSEALKSEASLLHRSLGEKKQTAKTGLVLGGSGL